MHAHLRSFLQFLRLNRNASAHTVRAYESDLTQFIGYVAADADLKKRDLQPSQLDRAALRGFLGELHKRGLSRASAARKLAPPRTTRAILAFHESRRDVITTERTRTTGNCFLIASEHHDRARRASATGREDRP